MEIANSYGKIALIFLLSLTLTIVLNILVQTRQNHIELGMEQVKLAEQGKAFTPRFAHYHYKYRVLVPFIVKALSVEVKEGFKLVAVISCFITLVCLGLILYSLRLELLNIAIGIILGAFTYTVILSLNYPYLPDGVNNALMAACYLGLVRRNLPLVAVTLVMGVLNHEAVVAYMILVPFLFCDKDKIVDKKGIVYFACMGGVVLLSKLAVTLYVGGGGAESRYLNYFTLSEIVGSLKDKGGVFGAMERIYITFHLLWILALLGFKKSDWRVRRSWIMLFPVVMFFVVLADTRRDISFLFPVIVTTGTYYFRDFTGTKLMRGFVYFFLLSAYIFITLLASRDNWEFFLGFDWPYIIEQHVFMVIGLASALGVIMICSNGLWNNLEKKHL